jgi:putative transposase
MISLAVIVAVDDRREVLGMGARSSEAETFWTAFLRILARRGLRSVKRVISDADESVKFASARRRPSLTDEP